MPNNRVPYVYRLTWSSSNVHYIGARGAKNCHPSDLWVTYFTSSAHVKKYIEFNGPPDIIKILKVFSNPEEAFAWERRILIRVNANKNPAFLNRSNGIDNFNYKDGFSDKSIIKKAHDTIIKNHGGFGSSSPYIKEKVMMTNSIRYGNYHTCSLPQVVDAREEACLRIWGVTNPVYSEEFQKSKPNPMDDPDIVKKHKEIMRHVDWRSRNEKTRKTVMESSGVPWVTMTDEFKKKQTHTCLEKYNNPTYFGSSEHRAIFEQGLTECPFCFNDKKYNFGNFKHHMKLHGWTSNQCTSYRVDGKIFPDSGDPLFQFKECPFCTYIGKTKALLDTHLKRHGWTREQMEDYRKTGTVYEDRRDYHKRNKPRMYNFVTCPYGCNNGEKFKNTTRFKQHLMRHGLTENEVKCYTKFGKTPENKGTINEKNG